ncbi:Pre-mRNA-splicing factor SYF1 [Hordeum vulgare]|nr:Pre-mRNA-splicing factor SYF1 [Hordeum vulgare]
MTGQKILNVDAFYSENDFTGACGAVIRNNRGGFIRAATARLDHVPDVVSAEAAALLEGLKLVESTGCNNLLVPMVALRLACGAVLRPAGGGAATTWGRDVVRRLQWFGHDGCVREGVRPDPAGSGA